MVVIILVQVFFSVSSHNIPFIGCAGPSGLALLAVGTGTSVCFGKFIERKSIKRDLEFILYYHLTIVKLGA